MSWKKSLMWSANVRNDWPLSYQVFPSCCMLQSMVPHCRVSCWQKDPPTMSCLISDLSKGLFCVLGWSFSSTKARRCYLRPPGEVVSAPSQKYEPCFPAILGKRMEESRLSQLLLVIPLRTVIMNAMQRSVSHLWDEMRWDEMRWDVVSRCLWLILKYPSTIWEYDYSIISVLEWINWSRILPIFKFQKYTAEFQFFTLCTSLCNDGL